MISLPWPDSALSPNSRPHHFTLARAKKKAKHDAFMLAKEALGRATLEKPLKAVVTFCPPDERKRDLDNMIASFKAAQDGIALAIGVDDSEWDVSYQRGPVKRRGEVLVTFGAVGIPFRGVIS